jgi:WD40 repeat protein
MRTDGFGVVDAATGSVLYEIKETKGGKRFAFSPDGKLLAGHVLTDDGNYRVKIYHAEDGKDKLTLGSARGNLAFSPDSRNLMALLVRGDLDPPYGPSELWVWDVQTGKVRLQRKGKGWMDAGFLADSKSVVLVVDERKGRAHGDHKVTVVDLATGVETKAVAPLGPTACFGRIDPEGRWVRERAQSKFDVPKFEWSFAKTELVPDRKLELEKDEDALFPQVLRFSQDSKEISLVYRGHTDGFGQVFDNQLYFLNAFTGKKLRKGTPIKGKNERMDSRSISADGKWAMCHDDGWLGIFDAASGETAFKVEQFKIGPEGFIPLLNVWSQSADFSPDSTRLALIDLINTRIQIWNLASRKMELFLPAGGPVEAVAYGPADQVAAVALSEGVVVWNARTGKKLAALGDKRGGNLWYELLFLPDGKRLLTRTQATQGAYPVIKVWDIATGTELSRFRFETEGATLWNGVGDAGTGHLFPLLLSQDGSRLVSSRRIWDVATGELVLMLPPEITMVDALSPDGRSMACRSLTEGPGIFEVP